MTSSAEKVSEFINRLSELQQSDPALFLQGVALFQDVRHLSMRHVRAKALHVALIRLGELIEATGFANHIVVRGDGIYVDVDGVLLDTLSNRLYLKNTGARQANIGKAMAEVLAKFGVSLDTVVDIGANFGEATLWFAKSYPRARVIAVEASSANRAVFEKNRRAQSFPTKNVELWPVALLNYTGRSWITAGVGTMNRVSSKPDQGTEEVDCDSLENQFRKHGVASADFVKIDIEGAEPLLERSLVSLGKRVRAYLIEFSKFSPLEDYSALATALIKTGFLCYDEQGSRPLKSGAEVENHLTKVLGNDDTIVTNLWFIAA
jgi:FkbM family methyltransferase